MGAPCLSLILHLLSPPLWFAKSDDYAEAHVHYEDIRRRIKRTPAGRLADKGLMFGYLPREQEWDGESWWPEPIND